MPIIRSTGQTEAGPAGAQPARDSQLEFRQNDDWGMASRSHPRVQNNILETFLMPKKLIKIEPPEGGI